MTMVAGGGGGQAIENLKNISTENGWEAHMESVALI